MLFNSPSIFWVTIFATFAILMLATLIGRLWCYMFPFHLRGQAKFYLAPLLGLGTMILLGVYLGRVFPMGDSVLVPLIISSIALWSVIQDRNSSRGIYQGFAVTFFGLICGVSLLVPLFSYGGYDSFNDTFTYLVHANWLQDHPFNNVIKVDELTPFNTQVALYQAGYRMGGSFLLALIQSLLNLKWSYEVYPAIVISAITTCFLAIGFPLARPLFAFQRFSRFVLLALPAFTIGGMVFGASFGFLAQTIGLSIGGGLLLALGPVFEWVTRKSTSSYSIIKIAIAMGMLFSAFIISYSELAPFLFLAVLLAGLVFGFRSESWKRVIALIGMMVIVAIIILNIELSRIYGALVLQTKAVVGGAVEWPVMGYLAHALGVHGGAWDGYQWSSSGAGVIVFLLGAVITVIFLVIILAGFFQRDNAQINRTLVPVKMALISLLIGFMYFRYFVPSPFSKGYGQSWSQFKLSDWAHPFLMALFLTGILKILKGAKNYSYKLLGALFITGFISTTFIAMERLKPQISYFGGTNNLNQFYREFQKTVELSCPARSRLYLNLIGQHHKFRQMVVYLFPDREVISDWRDDGYISSQLPEEKKVELTSPGDCVVEPLGQAGLLASGNQIGKFQVGIFDGKKHLAIASISGAYSRESDQNNWWYWVDKSISIKFTDSQANTSSSKAKLEFEYGVRTPQTLTLILVKSKGDKIKYELKSAKPGNFYFSQEVNLSLKEFSEIIITTDGLAYPLSDSDRRTAAWILRNLKVSSTDE